HFTPCFVTCSLVNYLPPQLFDRLHLFTHPCHTVGDHKGYFVSLRTIPRRCLLQQHAQIVVVVIALCFPYPPTTSACSPEALSLWPPLANMSPPVLDEEQ